MNKKNKVDAYKRFKDRIKKGKTKDKDIRGGRLVQVTFKFVNTLVNILDEIRKDRLRHRDIGITDFKNALNLYNEVLRGWAIRCVKTPMLTIIKASDESMDFIPLDNSIMRDKTRRDRFMGLKIRIKTIFTNLILNATDKLFPQPLMAFMNSFMSEGGFVPYDFFTEFEQDVLDFDSSDSLEGFGQRQKMLMIGSFILSQMMVDRIILKPVGNGFNTQISKTAMNNLRVMGALIHGIYSDLMFDIFQELLIHRKILNKDLSNKEEIV